MDSALRASKKRQRKLRKLLAQYDEALEVTPELILPIARHVVRVGYSDDDVSGIHELLRRVWFDSAGLEDPLIHWLRLAGIDCTLLSYNGPTWLVQVRNRRQQERAFQFIQRTPLDATVRYSSALAPDGTFRDDRERLEAPGSSIHTVPGGGVGVAGNRQRRHR